MKTGGAKELNFELDLLPVISVLSVCICFLLLTTVWTHVGSIDAKQGLGQESSRAHVKSPSLWITIRDGGAVTLTAIDSPAVPHLLRAKTFTIDGQRASWGRVIDHVMRLKRAQPKLETALIMPAATINYGDVVRIMDKLKGLGIGEIGIAPL